MPLLSQLVIGIGGDYGITRCEFPTVNKPSVWHRFWFRFFFGIRWRRIGY